ncbi:SHOCT domain-containing protein [Streptomyces sp. NPDC055239]
MTMTHWRGTEMYGYNMGGWGYALVTTLTGLLVIAALTAVVITFMRMAGQAGKPSPRPSPLDLLAERFARGEIDEAEYRRGATALMQPTARTDGGPTGRREGPSAS